MRTLSLDQARRIAVGAQGLDLPRPHRVDVRHFRKVMKRLKVVQLDSVNVLARAHYLPFFSRLGSYDRDALDRWINGPEVFEYWAHVASILPADELPLMRFRMEREFRSERVAKLRREHPGFIDQVLAEVTEHGPLTVSDLREPGERTGPWWGHGKGKIALDHLYSTGALTIRGRTPNFVSIYDIPERVFDRDLLNQHVPEVEAHRQLLVKAVQAHGVGTLSDLADYFRLSNPEARPRIAELVAEGTLEEVRVEGWNQVSYIDPAARLPRKITGRALLAPFDPLIWHRERTERLFGFRYRIEIYVPEPQRQYGYYVYPFLLNGELVARVDLKAERKAGVLRVLGSFVEDGVENGEVASQLSLELETMARWLGLGDIAVSAKGNLSTSLRSEF